MRHEVIMAGIGGRGVLLVGHILAKAGLAQYPHSLWYPTYGGAMRGGVSECTIVLSDEEISSPLLPQAQTVVVFESTQLKPFEPRVRPGGNFIYETAGVKENIIRKDIKAFPVNALELAVKLGNPQVANFILLGFYVKLTQPLPVEFIEKELEARFQGEMLEINRRAFQLGLGLEVN